MAEFAPPPKGFIKLSPHNTGQYGEVTYVNIDHIVDYTPVPQSDGSFVFQAFKSPSSLMVKESVDEIRQAIDYDRRVKAKL